VSTQVSDPRVIVSVMDCRFTTPPVGYRVRSADGHLGLVDAVHRDALTGEPCHLAVRAGESVLMLVPIAEIEAVVHDEGLVRLGPARARFVSEHRGDDIVLRPVD
jgi:hypothetical protein